MTIEVEEWYNNEGKLNMTISWDENDPIESILNDYTNEDFLNTIRDACEQQFFMGDKVFPPNCPGLHPTRESKEDIS